MKVEDIAFDYAARHSCGISGVMVVGEQAQAFSAAIDPDEYPTITRQDVLAEFTNVAKRLSTAFALKDSRTDKEKEDSKMYPLKRIELAFFNCDSDGKEWSDEKKKAKLDEWKLFESLLKKVWVHEN